ncbi:MAG: hypothetical protein CSA82_02660 [Actinobacteria bacterium]|nr:MAG: hypothetical protein CSA82_02660 [Actinomycetota bacterium]
MTIEHADVEEAPPSAAHRTRGKKCFTAENCSVEGPTPSESLFDVSVTLYRREFTAVLTGSSTSLPPRNGAVPGAPFGLFISGITSASTGKVKWPKASSWRARYARLLAPIAYIPSSPSLTYGLTVAQELATPLAGAGLTAVNTDYADVIARLEIGDIQDLPVDMLGTDQTMLVAIARSLMTSPAMLVLDEPTAHLTSAQANRLLAILDRLASDGLCVVLQTRHPDLAVHADRTLLLIDGQVAADLISPDIALLRHSYVSALRAAATMNPDASLEDMSSLAVTPTLSDSAAEGDDGRDAWDNDGEGESAEGEHRPLWAPVDASSTSIPMVRPIPVAVDKTTSSSSDSESPSDSDADTPSDSESSSDSKEVKSPPADEWAEIDPEVEMTTSSLNRLSQQFPPAQLSEDSAEVVTRAQQILTDLPGSVMPTD